jgi:hypothetical protein
MVYVEREGHMFMIDLTAPTTRARMWAESGWIDDFWTNEEVLFDYQTRSVSVMAPGPLRSLRAA